MIPVFQEIDRLLALLDEPKPDAMSDILRAISDTQVAKIGPLAKLPMNARIEAQERADYHAEEEYLDALNGHIWDGE